MIPDFVIIGAPRAGTTSLYHYLSQHPQICMSRIKETNFFAYLASQAAPGFEIGPSRAWVATSFQEYHELFEAAKSSSVTGEASPFYLYTPGTPRQIKAHVPDVKLIVILREPVERAYSGYLKNLREGNETRPFEEAINQEIYRPIHVLESKNYYVRTGLYFHHITRYLEHFDRSQMKITIYEELENAPQGFLRDVFDFINVDPEFVPDLSVRFNQAIPPFIKDTSQRRRIMHLTRRIRGWLLQKISYFLLNLKHKIGKKVATYPALVRETHLVLRDQYIHDVANLEKLINRDLSHWLTVE